MTFEEWFKKEHVVLDVYVFDNQGAAESWYNQLKVAFAAGALSNKKEPEKLHRQNTRSEYHMGYEPNYRNLDDGYQ